MCSCFSPALAGSDAIRIAELPVNTQLTGSDFYFFWYGGKGAVSRGSNVEAIRDSVRTVALAFFGMLNELSYAQSHFGQVCFPCDVKSFCMLTRFCTDRVGIKCSAGNCLGNLLVHRPAQQVLRSLSR